MNGTLSTRGSALLDWYWHKGVQRTGEFDLSGAWLDQLYQIRDAAAAVEAARASGRPCLALWGPSQSGKSTLLSRYLDMPSHPEAVSALQWDPQTPVAFVGRPDRPGCVHLNPYNQQRDASGCVTRFTLCREVPDARHPVELKLASEEQLLHALAAGYVMECDTRTADAREVFHEAGKLDHKLSELQARFRGRGAASRPVRERLQTVLNVLDDLIAADWPRYRNLKPDWRSLRPRLASNSLLRSDAAALAEFAGWLFWDGQPALTGLWQKLVSQRNKALGQTAGRPILCTHPVAQLFLDIDSYRKLEQHQESSAIGNIGWLGAEHGLCIGADLPNQLFAGAEEFGLWQGLVWETTLPVNAALLPEDSPAAALLLAADLLDFPGVALTYPGGERKKVEQMSQAQLLTEVLKRGKTASIVVTRSRQLGIDGFSILNRIQAPPAQPTQLLTGVQAWVRALGQTWPPPRTLPINLVLTFAARLVNGVVDGIQLQRKSVDFSPVFEFLSKLGELANPQWVQFFTTTYPRFDEGCIRGNAAEVETAARMISQSEDFRRHLGDCMDSLSAMVKGGRTPEGDGGADYLLNRLARQAKQSRVPALLEERARELQRQFAALLEEALPPAAAAESRRSQELESWGAAIEQAIDRCRQQNPETDAAAHVSQRLRQLLNVEPGLLEPIPLAGQNPDWRHYMENQFLRWRELGKGRDGDWLDLGLKDAATTSRHLGYLAEQALLLGNVHRWLRENLGHLIDHVEAAHARRFLAVRMAEIVCFGVEGLPPHRGFAAEAPAAAAVTANSIQPRLRGYAEREQLDADNRDDRQSPHYLGFVTPFLQHLRAVKAKPATARKPQPGDAELAQLAAQAAGRS